MGKTVFDKLNIDELIKDTFEKNKGIFEIKITRMNNGREELTKSFVLKVQEDVSLSVSNTPEEETSRHIANVVDEFKKQVQDRIDDGTSGFSDFDKSVFSFQKIVNSILKGIQSPSEDATQKLISDARRKFILRLDELEQKEKEVTQ